MHVVEHPLKANTKPLGSDSHIQIPLRTGAKPFDPSGPSLTYFPYRMVKVLQKKKLHGDLVSKSRGRVWFLHLPAVVLPLQLDVSMWSSL